MPTCGPFLILSPCRALGTPETAKYCRLIFEQKAMVQFKDCCCLGHWELEKIKGDGRAVCCYQPTASAPQEMCEGSGWVCT